MNLICPRCGSIFELEYQSSSCSDCGYNFLRFVDAEELNYEQYLHKLGIDII